MSSWHFSDSPSLNLKIFGAPSSEYENKLSGDSVKSVAMRALTADGVSPSSRRDLLKSARVNCFLCECDSTR